LIIYKFKKITMNNPEINSMHGGELYNFLYLAAFLMMSAFYIISGLKDKYSFRKLWLIASAGAVFFILGNKFFAISPQDWNDLFIDPMSVSHGAKAMLGGLAGLCIGSLLVIRWLKLDARIADHAAIGLPVALAVTRLGCLFSGCCYGNPTGLPWAVSYTAGRPAYDQQLSAGMILPADQCSLPVHPVQVYDILCCVIIAIVVWKTSIFLKANGNKLLLAILLYGFARFFLEFFRDPAANFYAGETWMNIKYVQWILVVAVLMLGLLIFIREKIAKAPSAETMPDCAWSQRSFSLLAFLLLVYFILFSWFDALERTTIGLMLIPAVAMLAWSFAGRYFIRHYRMVTAITLLSGLLFMGQTYIPENDSTKVRFYEVGVGGLFGKYYTETAQKLWEEAFSGGSDCTGHYYPPHPAQYSLANYATREHAFRQYGFNASYHVRTGKYKRFSTGLNGFYGIEKESYTLSSIDSLGYSTLQAFESKIPEYAVNPYLSYDMKNIGVDLGFHAGNFRVYDKTDEPTLEDPENQVQTMHFLPQFGLRIGPQHIIYLDARYCSAFPTCFPTSMFSIGLASGLGRWNGMNLGAGYCSSGYYSTATVVIKEKFLLDLAFTYDIWHDTGGKNTGSFSLAMHYRFGYKTFNKDKGK
jgi:prolipoprotein diacylglyceryltransferase